MKAVPMIFNTEMVKALIDGRKTVTRRPIQPTPSVEEDFSDDGYSKVIIYKGRELMPFQCPYGSVGDLIYVRETFRLYSNTDECGCYDHCSCPPNGTPLYFATHDDGESKWKPSIHMPRSISRLTLKVSDVRIEQIQDITDEQAIDEGISSHPSLPAWLSPVGYHTTPIYAYEELWNSLYSNWEENPYVWVIEFEVIRKNVDQVLREIEVAA